MRGTGVDFRWGYIVRSSPDVDLIKGGWVVEVRGRGCMRECMSDSDSESKGCIVRVCMLTCSAPYLSTVSCLRRPDYRGKSEGLTMMT